MSSEEVCLDKDIDIVEKNIDEEPKWYFYSYGHPIGTWFKFSSTLENIGKSFDVGINSGAPVLPKSEIIDIDTEKYGTISVIHVMDLTTLKSAYVRAENVIFM